MNIKFNINDKEYCTLTKSANYGFTLEHFYPTFNPRTKQETIGSKSYFYATLQQAAEKIVWMGLDGNGVQEVIDSMVALSENITKTLEKL